MINNILKYKDFSYAAFLSRAYPEIFADGKISNDASLKCKNITFQITNDCNLRCSYCYEINKKHEYMTFDTAKKFIDNLLDNNYSNYHFGVEETAGVVFEFIGGEPFLHIKLIHQICDYIEEELIKREHPWLLFHRYSISSNGVLYFEDEVQNFLNRYKNLLSLNITVDGNKDLHDSCRKFPDGRPSYDLAYRAAMDWKDKTGESISKITLAPANINFTADAIINYINSKFTTIFANCAFEEGWNNTHATVFYQELKKIANYLLENNLETQYNIDLFNFKFFTPMGLENNENWCGGNGQMLAIDPNGVLFPCIRFMDTSLGMDQKALSIGHVNTFIGSTEDEQKNIQLLSNVTRRSQSTDECFYCPIAKGCAWCSGYNYQKFGTLHHRATYICCMHKARALANVYYWNMLFQKHNIPYYMPMNCPKEWALEIINEEEYNNLLSLILNKEDYINVINL